MKRPIVVTQELDPDKEQAETLALIAQLEAVRDGQTGAARGATDKTIANMRRGLAAAQDSFAGIRHRASQRENAKKPRNDTRVRIEAALRTHRHLSNVELLVHVNAEAGDGNQITLKTLANTISKFGLRK